jgi:hypothetical protein
LRPFERSRDERSARRAAFAPIESFDGGVEEFVESIPSRRRSSAFSASNTSTRVTNPTTSAASSSYEGWDDSGADTTQMIDNLRPNNEPDTPSLTKINSVATAQLNGTREWTPIDDAEKILVVVDRLIRTHTDTLLLHLFLNDHAVTSLLPW